MPDQSARLTGTSTLLVTLQIHTMQYQTLYHGRRPHPLEQIVKLRQADSLVAHHKLQALCSKSGVRLGDERRRKRLRSQKSPAAATPAADALRSERCCNRRMQASISQPGGRLTALALFQGIVMLGKASGSTRDRRSCPRRQRLCSIKSAWDAETSSTWSAVCWLTQAAAHTAVRQCECARRRKKYLPPVRQHNTVSASPLWRSHTARGMPCCAPGEAVLAAPCRCTALQAVLGTS